MERRYFEQRKGRVEIILMRDIMLFFGFLDVLSGLSLACFCRCCPCVGLGVCDGKGRRGTNSPGDRNLCP